MAKRVTAEQVQDNLGDVLRAVHAGKEPVIVEQGGQPMAVLISPEDWGRYLEQTKERFFQTVDELRRENRDVDPDAVMRDVTDAVREVRRRRHEQERRQPPHRG